MLVNKNQLDVVVIAIKRPEILRLCLETFKRNLLNQFDVRIIINVDPVGEENYSQKDIVNIAKEYFPKVISRTPRKGNFSKAVYWGWRQVKTEFFFHLEDDWLLKDFIPAYRLQKKIAIKDIVSITFNITSNKKYPKLYEAYHLKTFSLRPCVFRSKYIKEKEDKIKVLDNLIALYGPDPLPEYNKGLGIFIADVYGDRHTSGCPSEMKISDCYKKALYPYCGSYIAMEWNTHIRYYKPDGKGKYVFYKIEKKL